VSVDCKVPDQVEKKKPIKKKYSSGCHKPFLIYIAAKHSEAIVTYTLWNSCQSQLIYGVPD